MGSVDNNAGVLGASTAATTLLAGLGINPWFFLIVPVVVIVGILLFILWKKRKKNSETKNTTKAKN
jgi:hypothetical protein